MILELIGGLSKMLSSETEIMKFRLPGDGEKYASPRIFAFDLPEEQSGGDFPFVIIFPDSTRDENETKIFDVRLGFGIYTAESESEAGWEDIATMGDHLRLAVRKNEVVNERFLLRFPFETRYGEPEDERLRQPYFDGLMLLKYERGL